MSKTNNKQNRNNQQKQKAKKNSKLPLLIAAVLIVCVTAVVFIFDIGGADDSQKGNLSNNNTTSENTAQAGDSNIDTNGMQVINAGESLIIPIDEVSETATFYPIEVDGTEMEVLAVKDSGGTIRTAFNTCQVCYDSGRGYYVQEGNMLVCQNCGNQFTVDQVEIESGGCNPWPIFAENKTVTEETIQISYEFLKESTIIFADWRYAY